MEPYGVLMSVARDLQAEAVRYVALVVKHGPHAVPDPFGSLIAAQDVATPDLFQLPEPLLHPIARPDVLAVGLNPGYNAAESMPTLSSPAHVLQVRGTACVQVVGGVPSGSSPWATAHADRSKTPASSTAR
jgi:hypothetical protein